MSTHAMMATGDPPRSQERMMTVSSMTSSQEQSRRSAALPALLFEVKLNEGRKRSGVLTTKTV
jgi:hypothetical protein